MANGDQPPIREDSESVHLTPGILRILNRQVGHYDVTRKLEIGMREYWNKLSTDFAVNLHYTFDI